VLKRSHINVAAFLIGDLYVFKRVN